MTEMMKIPVKKTEARKGDIPALLWQLFHWIPGQRFQYMLT